MGKVRELAEEWAHDVQMMAFRAGSGYTPRPCEWLRAEAEDAAAHAAELEAKDRRIAELESEGRFARNKCTEHAGRIRELEAELAKRELPPLPESVREWVSDLRGMRSLHQAARDLVDWFDTHYPAPVPQWELDAQYLERKLGGETRSAFSPDEVRAIAARMREREAGRGSK